MTPPGSQTTSRRQARVEVLGVWLALALYSTVTFWSDLVARIFRDPDDAMRLVQVRELLAGQSWWNLTLDRLGTAGVEMHWSRHMDGLLGGIVVLFRPFIGAEAAELTAIIVVPLGLLLAALWLISSLARLLSSNRDAGLYAMVVAALTVGVLQRLSPGALDHHGLQIVLVLVVMRMVVGPPTRRAGLLAGVAAGVSITVGLETFPVIAAVLAGLGIAWAAGSTRPRIFYRALGSGLAVAAIASSYLFGPAGRLLSRECDVLSLGYFGLIALPALALAVVGGRAWTSRNRWGVLVAIGATAFLWFGVISPECATGPYTSVPEAAKSIWLDQIAEARTFANLAAERPFRALGMAVGPLSALVYLVWIVWSDRRHDWAPVLIAMLAAIGIGGWQVRAAPLALALGAPVLGVLVVRLRDVLGSDVGRATVALGATLALSGLVPSLVGQNGSSGPEVAAVEGKACIDSDISDALNVLEPGMLAVEMDLGPTILVQTDQRVLASHYHRGYRDILAMYDLLVSDVSRAESLARSMGVDYVLICDGSPLMRNWQSDGSDGLLAVLLVDDPPGWLEKVVDIGRSRVYAVR